MGGGGGSGGGNGGGGAPVQDFPLGTQVRVYVWKVTIAYSPFSDDVSYGSDYHESEISTYMLVTSTWWWGPITIISTEYKELVDGEQVFRPWGLGLLGYRSNGLSYDGEPGPVVWWSNIGFTVEKGRHQWEQHADRRNCYAAEVPSECLRWCKGSYINVQIVRITPIEDDLINHTYQPWGIPDGAQDWLNENT